MSACFSTLAVLALSLLASEAVKIGVSKTETTTTAPNTTTIITTIAPTTTPYETSISLTEDFSTDPTTEEATNPSTNTPNFTLSIFPPRKTPKVTTKSPPIVTTTASPDDNDTLFGNVTILTLDGVATWPANNFYCKCDLLWHACDINCCCDRDCSREALVVFDCNVVPKHPELRSRLEDFQYQHGLPSCQINDGWLCVFRSNVKPLREKPINMDFLTTKLYKWEGQVVAETELQSEIYKYGDAIKLLNLETMETVDFELPNTFRPPYCHIQAPIRYLKAYSASCLMHSALEMHAPLHKLLATLRIHKLQLKPLRGALEQENLDSAVADIEVTLCRDTNCAPLESTNSTDMKKSLENVLITEVIVRLVHNYTQLLAARLELHETVEKQEMDTTNEYWQSYSVMFIHLNASTTPHSNWFNASTPTQPKPLTSGPLGYLQGEPLIVAKFVAYNQSEELSTLNQVLSYFQPNFTLTRENLTLPLFSKHQMLCSKSASPSKRRSINYGINTFKQCKVRLEDIQAWLKAPQRSNWTALCERLQRLTLQHLFGAHYADLSLLYISQLGRPLNDTGKWSALRVENAEQAPVVGAYSEQTRSFSCRNMLLSATYEFKVGQFVERRIANQALVKRASLVLAPRNDLDFALNEAVEVPITLSVMFYDYAQSDAVVRGFGLHFYLCIVAIACLVRIFVEERL